MLAGRSYCPSVTSLTPVARFQNDIAWRGRRGGRSWAMGPSIRGIAGLIVFRPRDPEGHEHDRHLDHRRGQPELVAQP